MELTSSTQPNFIVVYIQYISATKLRMPTHMSLVLQESVTLTDRYKNNWQVEATKVDGNWYLLEGWAKFVTDNSISDMDVLDFHYCGPGSLDVYILDIAGDMKKGVGYCKIDNPKEHMNMEIDESEYANTFVRVPTGNVEGTLISFQKRSNINDCRGNMIITSRSASRPNIPSSAEKMPPRRVNDMNNKGKGILNESSDKDSNFDYWAYDAYDEKSEEDFVFKINGLVNAKKYKLKARDAKASKRAKRGSVKFDILGNKIFESGVIPRPTCTYFVTKMKPGKSDELHIPEEIVIGENLQFPETLMLADPKGNAYISSLTSQTGNGRIYKGGWKLLCGENDLTENDICICEFGEGDQAGFLYINIVRLERR